MSNLAPQSNLVTTLVLTLCLSACTSLDIVKSITTPSGSTLSEDIAYGTNPRQKLDIYRPSQLTTNTAVIVFFYGGAWDDGDKSEYEFVARRLALSGHYVVIPDYRLFPEVVFPTFVEDAALAVKHVIANLTNIAEFERPLFLMGHSAGAHIAMMLAVDSKYLQQSLQQVRGVIGLSGPYDFLPLHSKRLEQIFPSDIRSASQPINFVNGDEPPIFIGQGGADQRVWMRNATQLDSALKNHNVPSVLRIYPGVNHSGTLKPYVRFLDRNSPIPRDIEQFIRFHTNYEDHVDR